MNQVMVSLVIGLLTAFFMGICLCLMGCTSPMRPTRIIEVPAYTLVLMDHRTLAPALGQCDMKNRIVYVRWDAWNDRPNFETYGHEVWHFSEQGGRWHK
jgi:hypothetical protein